MRTFSILLSVLFMCVSCNCQKKVVESATTNSKTSNNLTELVYTANSRGFFHQITIKNQELLFSKDRDSKQKSETLKISDTDWKELVGYMNALKLDKLETYKDPTQKRFYDGAAIANLKVVDKEKEYKTVDFDHGFPPVEIEKLVNKINSLFKAKE